MKTKNTFFFLIIKFTWIYEHEFMFIDHFKKIHTEKNIQCLYFRLENPGNWRAWNSQNFLCYESSIPYFKKSINFCIFHPNFTKFCTFILHWGQPVMIRVRIDPPHPLVCRKRRLNGAVLRMRPEKPRKRVTAGVAR